VIVHYNDLVDYTVLSVYMHEVLMMPYVLCSCTERGDNALTRPSRICRMSYRIRIEIRHALTCIACVVPIIVLISRSHGMQCDASCYDSLTIIVPTANRHSGKICTHE